MSQPNKQHSPKKHKSNKPKSAPVNNNPRCMKFPGLALSTKNSQQRERLMQTIAKAFNKEDSYSDKYVRNLLIKNSPCTSDKRSSEQPQQQQNFANNNYPPNNFNNQQPQQQQEQQQQQKQPVKSNNSNKNQSGKQKHLLSNTKNKKSTINFHRRPSRFRSPMMNLRNRFNRFHQQHRYPMKGLHSVNQLRLVSPSPPASSSSSSSSGRHKKKQPTTIKKLSKRLKNLMHHQRRRPSLVG